MLIANSLFIMVQTVDYIVAAPSLRMTSALIFYAYNKHELVRTLASSLIVCQVFCEVKI